MKINMSMFQLYDGFLNNNRDAIGQFLNLLSRRFTFISEFNKPYKFKNHRFLRESEYSEKGLVHCKDFEFRSFSELTLETEGYFFDTFTEEQKYPKAEYKFSTKIFGRIGYEEWSLAKVDIDVMKHPERNDFMFIPKSVNMENISISDLINEIEPIKIFAALDQLTEYWAERQEAHYRLLLECRELYKMDRLMLMPPL